MSPDRVKVVNGFRVEQFYWGGKQVVYIENKLVKKSFDSINLFNVGQLINENENPHAPTETGNDSEGTGTVAGNTAERND